MNGADPAVPARLVVGYSGQTAPDIPT